MASVTTFKALSKYNIILKVLRMLVQEKSRWFGMKETNRDYNYCEKTMQKGQGHPGKKITNLKSLIKRNNVFSS